MTFQDRMFLASQAVYEEITRGECPDVEAALLDAQMNASVEDDDR
ncbi:hypothetical protein OH768_44110 [Streptomyces sp. NBC_01622]|nr:hypothetical protein OH768_24860 [Streptomyces sp. NBC_01622]WTE46865.1 hypothetical protein OH768_44110 [Streptomyces sp. NBC_01622]